ncbi:Alpha/Beta hydrolase protein [Hysterangium stoloniferum]|nr:Alpha/Beta hydrolase protein [Hysterangium stoloniferum]
MISIAIPEDLHYERPTEKIKTLDVPSLDGSITAGLKKYQDASQGYTLGAFERLPQEQESVNKARLYIFHRPADAQVVQIYRVPHPEDDSLDLERVTHFNMGTGITIVNFSPIVGDDWHGSWRAGGAIFAMDLDGSEKFQLWQTLSRRFWENSGNVLPALPTELDNKPGKGRIERLTHDGFRYSQITVSGSNKIFAYLSTKENGKDTLVYIAKLTSSPEKGTQPTDADVLALNSRLITAPTQASGKTSWWNIQSISPDDKSIILTKLQGSSSQPLYIVDISDPSAPPVEPELIVLPGAASPEGAVAIRRAKFSQTPGQEHLLYIITDAYGDFTSVITYDIQNRSVAHITTPEPSLRSIGPIPWNTQRLTVSPKYVLFTANVEGWSNLFVFPLEGEHQGKVILMKFEQETCAMTYITNASNEEPWHVILNIASSRTAYSLFSLDLRLTLEKVEKDEEGQYISNASVKPYSQAQALTPEYRTLPPRLLKYRSFDDLPISAMYYHPFESQKPAPLIISIHGGPASQSTSLSKMPIHGYLLNELGCAIMYPNVRGSDGYGKRFMAADDVEKREDSVKDIGSLLGYIQTSMKEEILSDRIAVVGSSYGGYMTYACLVHYSPQLRCGVATCPIGDWPSFLKNTADYRRANRRLEYGDESDPAICEFLTNISPLNHAQKVTVPLMTSHGENDTRVPVEEAIKMWSMVKRNGVHTELLVARGEGHGLSFFFLLRRFLTE